MNAIHLDLDSCEKSTRLRGLDTAPEFRLFELVWRMKRHDVDTGMPVHHSINLVFWVAWESRCLIALPLNSIQSLRLSTLQNHRTPVIFYLMMASEDS